MDDFDYWKECISDAAYECEASLTKEQLDYIAEAVSGYHENYDMAFYSPPASERLDDIRREHEEKYKRLKAEFDKYRGNAETAVKRALRTYSDEKVSIEENGEVLSHDGRTTRIL